MASTRASERCAKNGRLLKCRFCSKQLFNKHFRLHLFGFRNLPAQCAAARQAYPDGMTIEQFKTIQKAATSDAITLLKKQNKQFLLGSKKLRAIEKKRAKSSSSSTLSPLFNHPEVTKCGVCQQVMSSATMLYLPCCEKQQTCLWCIVKMSQNNGSSPVKCQECQPLSSLIQSTSAVQQTAEAGTITDITMIDGELLLETNQKQHPVEPHLPGSAEANEETTKVQQDINSNNNNRFRFRCACM